jgi:hypothetical protein
LWPKKDAEITALRRCFGPKRWSDRRDGEKARWRKRLPVAHQCTEVAHGVHSPRGETGVRAVCVVPMTLATCATCHPGLAAHFDQGRGEGKLRQGSPGSLPPQGMDSEGARWADAGQRHIDKIPRMRYSRIAWAAFGRKADDGQLGDAPNQTNPRKGSDSIS